MRRSGPMTQRSRYQSPATLPGLGVEVIFPLLYEAGRRYGEGYQIVPAAFPSTRLSSRIRSPKADGEAPNVSSYLRCRLARPKLLYPPDPFLILTRRCQSTRIVRSLS